MRKLLFSTKNNKTSDVALLLLRIGFGILMIPHGWAKLMKFETLQHEFMNFMGLGSTISLSLVLFSEICCSALLLLGAFTRWATIPLIITALVILSKHDWAVFGKAELGTAYLFAYLVILLAGPGKYSIDAALFKSKR